MNPEIQSEIFPPATKLGRRKRNARLRGTIERIQQQSIGGQGDLRRWLAPVVLLLVAGLASIFWNRPAELSLDQSLLGILIIGLGCLPLILYLHEVNRSPLPFLSLVGLFYANNFGLPLFTAHLQQSNTSPLFRVENVSIFSLWLTVGGMVCMFFMFLAAERTIWRGIRPVQIPWDGGSFQLRLFVWVCLVVHLVYYALPVLQVIPTLGQLAEPVGFLAWGMILTLGLLKRLSSLEKYLLAPAGLMFELMFRSTTGLLSSTTFFGLFLAFVAFRFRHKLGIAIAAFSIAFLIILNPVKTEYRAATWNGNEGNYSPLQRLELFAQLAKDYYSSAGFHPVSQENAALLAERISTIGVFSVVVNMTPASVPYMNGTTYYSLLTKWIPRFLWPGKPEERTGNDFGQRYGFLDESDRDTSLNFPWIVELYANFGAWGVLLGMGIFGAFLAFLNRLFNQPQANPLEFVYGMTLLFGLTMQESSFSLMVGNVFLLSVVLYMLLKWTYGRGVAPAKRMRRKPAAGNAG